ncbi:MAG: FecR domain-containing protein [Lentisphaeraceae bacterium]|nr:FecR domain-containing protein [Lentisphaeraceae bacterium]
MIDERLEDLLLAFSSGDITEEEVRELEVYLEDPINRARLVDFMHEEATLLDVFEQEKSQKVKTVKKKIKTNKLSRVSRKKKKKAPVVLPWIGVAIAASIIFAFVLLRKQGPVDSIVYDRLVVEKVYGNSANVKKGDVLSLGDQIKTGEGSRVYMNYTDGTLVKLSSDSLMTLNKGTSTKSIHLETGHVHLDVIKQKAGDPLLVHTAKSTARVLGTVLEVSKSDHHSRLDVYEGRVEYIRHSDQKTVLVNKREYADANHKRFLSRSRVPNSNNYVAFWDFDRGFGDVAEDVSEHGNDAIIHGAKRVLGKRKGALTFDGIDDYVDAGKFDVNSNVMTISSWIKIRTLEGLSGEGRIISKVTPNKTKGLHHVFMLSPYPSGDGHGIRFRLTTSDKTSILISDPQDLKVGEWIHVAAVYDGKAMILYLDGKEISREAKTGNINRNGSKPVWIGGNPGDPTSRPFAGEIDDLRIFRKALTPVQIRELAQ